MQQEVKNAIQAKDDELDDCVANMGDEELDRTLIDCVPSGMDELNLWKRDRRKSSWQRLSAFGIVRDDPSLYSQWKHQRQQQQGEAANDEIGEKADMLGTTCSTDAARRQPWSTDLHYTHRRGVPQKHPPTSEVENMHPTKETLIMSRESNRSKRTESSGNLSRSSTRTKVQPANRRKARARPASAPSGSISERVAIRPSELPETTRSPGLARLARVFYQSSVASIASMPGSYLNQSSGFQDQELHGETAAEEDCPARTPSAIPEIGSNKVDGKRESSQVVNTTSSVHGRPGGASAVETSVTEESLREIRDAQQPYISGAGRRMEGVRLLWAVSQLSAEAVTKKIMHGYSERQRAREPNRRWMTSTRRPQPPEKKSEEGNTPLTSRVA